MTSETATFARARHRRPSRRPAPLAYALQHKKIAAALAGSTLFVAAAAPVAFHWRAAASHPAALDQTQALSSPGSAADAAADQGGADQVTAGGATELQPGMASASHNQWSQIPMAKVTAGRLAGAQRRSARRAAAQRAIRSAQAKPSQAQQPAAASTAVYRNPLRSVSGLIPERVDMGVDFGGAGPVYALGNAVITNATASNSGWPGGGWITYRLTSGPASGLMVYFAEDVTPAVQVGQTVTSSTVIGNMFNGSAGVETGWAMPDGSSAESQLPEAGGVSGGGPFPTMVGLNFETLLRATGVPAAPNAAESGNGTLPSNYPTDWTAATKP
jgi:murein DD-endopeptidase MepM/ murein hydrolase activator NlpD